MKEITGQNTVLSKNGLAYYLKDDILDLYRIKLNVICLCQEQAELDSIQMDILNMLYGFLKDLLDALEKLLQNKGILGESSDRDDCIFYLGSCKPLYRLCFPEENEELFDTFLNKLKTSL